MFKENCPRCGGKCVIHSSYHREMGRYFQCGGTGVVEFKTSKEQRERNNEKARERKAAKEVNNLAEFEAAWPDIAAWWKDSTFPFAISLREAATKYGDLTPGQMNAALKCVNKIKSLKEASAARIASAVNVNIEHVTTSLKNAYNRGIRRPKLRLFAGESAFEFSRAPDNGRNAGAIYVSEGDLYLGKIVEGKFVRGRDCSDEYEKAILEACSNPEQAAVAYGRRFGSCSCCGRELTNQESIDLGIGPICRAKFFG